MAGLGREDKKTECEVPWLKPQKVKALKKESFPQPKAANIACRI
jgi:hypothetical protein